MNRLLEDGGVSQGGYEGLLGQGRGKSLEESFGEISIDGRVTGGRVEISRDKVKLEQSLGSDNPLLGDKKTYHQMVSDCSGMDDGPKSGKKKKTEDLSGFDVDDSGIERLSNLDVVDCGEKDSLDNQKSVDISDLIGVLEKPNSLTKTTLQIDVEKIQETQSVPLKNPQINSKPDNSKFHPSIVILENEPICLPPKFPEWKFIDAPGNFPIAQPPENYQEQTLALNDKNLDFIGATQIEECELNGYGRLQQKDTGQTIYTGYWQNGLKHGKPHSSPLRKTLGLGVGLINRTTKYNGDWQQGLQNGWGSILKLRPDNGDINCKIFLEQAFANFLEWNFALEFADPSGNCKIR